jgi:hypothetical protein
LSKFEDLCGACLCVTDPTSVSGKVFDMILSLQFLEIDEIPVLLFDFLSSDTDYANQAMETNNFIQAMQTFSFGKIEGEDDNRFLCTHLAVIRALKIFTDQSLPPAPDTDVGSVTHTRSCTYTNDRRNSISDLHDRSFDANLSAWCRTDFA